jgi:hypothetical protein
MCYNQAKTGTAAIAVDFTLNANTVRVNSFAQSSQSVTNSIRLCPVSHGFGIGILMSLQSVDGIVGQTACRIKPSVLLAPFLVFL